MTKKTKNMSKIEKIVSSGKVIALIMYRGFRQDGISFFSSREYPLQIGAMSRPKGYQITPHIHKPVKRLISGTQEVLFIQSGQVRITFYSLKRTLLKSRKLVAGDIVFFIGAGHGIDFIKKSVIFEVKNGPYIKSADKSKFVVKKRAK